MTVLLKFMTTRLLFEFKRGGKMREFKPSQVLSHINRGLINCKLGKHVTMVGGVIDEDTGLLTYSVGGHLPLPVLYTPGKPATSKAAACRWGCSTRPATRTWCWSCPSSSASP